MKQTNLPIAVVLCIVAIAGMSGLAAAEAGTDGTQTVNNISQQESLNAIMAILVPPQMMPSEQFPEVVYAIGKIRDTTNKDIELRSVSPKVAVAGFMITNPGPKNISIDQIVILEDHSQGVSVSVPFVLLDRKEVKIDSTWIMGQNAPLKDVIKFDTPQAIAAGETADLEILVGIGGVTSGNFRITLDSMRWTVNPKGIFPLTQTGAFGAQGEVLTIS